MITHSSKLVIVTMLLALSSGSVFALEEGVNVTRDGSEFHITMKLVVDQPLESVIHVLADMGNYSTLHHSITKSWVEYLGPNFKPRVRTRITGCVWFFCKKMGWAGDVKPLQKGKWEAAAISKKSSFRDAKTIWGAEAHDDESKSWFVFDTKFKTTFWIPPGIGQWLIRTKLESESKEFIEKLEKRSNEIKQ